MPKPTLHSARRALRFSKSGTPHHFHLPPRFDPSSRAQPRAGFHTYYLSCDVRSLSLYLPHAVKNFQKGFRAALVAPAGLMFEPPTIVLLGLQDGDSFDHAMRWASSNPIDDFQEFLKDVPGTMALKEHTKIQGRFEDAVCTLEGVKEALVEAEAEVEAATQALITAQGLESICVKGIYYDPTYSRERIYLKRRDPRFNPVEEEPVENIKKPAKKASKRSRRAA